MSSKAFIDSINLKNYSFEEQVFNDDNFIIEPVKTISIFKPQRWLEEFGKTTSRNLVEAKILHTLNGSVLPLKRYSVQPTKQIIEFAGLNGYTNKSTLLKKVFKELREKLQDSYVVRLDIAIDMDCIPNSVIQELLSHRKAFKYGNTIYYKTVKEKKTNTYIDIKIYNKALCDGLAYDLFRLEFCFKGRALKQIELKDIEKEFKKLENKIKKFSGLSVKIQSL